MLADELVAMDFNLREFLRQIALSQTYQRSIEFPATASVALSDVEVEMQELTAAVEVGR